MLVITRPDESFLIGDDVEVTILKIVGRKVRVGIVAPKTVRVLRSELTDPDRKPPRKKSKE